MRFFALGLTLCASSMLACAAGEETSATAGTGGTGPGTGTSTGTSSGSVTTSTSGGTTTTGNGGAGGAGTTGSGGETSSSTTTASSSTTSTTASSSSASSGAGGAAMAGEVYGHSDKTLYLLDPIAQTVSTIGNFDCVSIALPGSGEGMWDIALDKNGNMVGTSMSLFNGGALVNISKVNAHCTNIASGDYPNSLTFVPEGTLDPLVEVLVGYKGAQYVRIDPGNGAQMVIGNLNPNPTGQDWESSGDIVALIGGQAYLTVKPLGSGANYAGTDRIVEVDILTGQATNLIGDTTYPKLWGLGYWAGVAYGFSSFGQLIEINLNNASTTPIQIPGGYSFWGAGVTTAAPHL